jgi:hypothetical protein
MYIFYNIYICIYGKIMIIAAPFLNHEMGIKIGDMPSGGPKRTTPLRTFMFCTALEITALITTPVS